MRVFYTILLTMALYVCNSYAGHIENRDINITTQNFLRFTDTKEEYGKECEMYEYIAPMQRVTLLKHSDALFGDILSDSVSIASVEPDIIVETNLTNCDAQDSEVGIFIYEENIAYINRNIVTIDVFEYSYAAGAAHGNSHESHYIYDRDYGMNLTWEDIFGENESFELYIVQRVVKEIADEEFMHYFKSDEQLFNFRKPGYFGIIDEGLLIQYGKYEITPGASGLPSLIVPKEILRKYMTPSIYAKCFPSDTKYMVKVI